MAGATGLETRDLHGKRCVWDKLLKAGNSKSSGAQKSRSDPNLIRVPDRELLGVNFFLGSTNGGVAIGPNPRIENEAASNISAQTYLKNTSNNKTSPREWRPWFTYARPCSMHTFFRAPRLSPSNGEGVK